MSQEIERKFILSKIPKNLPALKIKQGYLQLDKNCTIRVRSTFSSKGSKNTLTIKGPTSLNGMSRYEFETELSESDAISLFKICHNPIIEKTRYIYLYDSMKWELDEFHGANQGLLIGEIELESETEKFNKPNIVLKEVTGEKKYYNSMLQQSPFNSWK
tara:strand:+ start:109 stop:585 length:477 start_codon:yes stop_codon:yes gene_type:complete